MRSAKRVNRSFNSRSTPTSPTDGTHIEVQLETLNIEQYNLQFHIASVEGMDPMPRSPLSPGFLKKYNEPQRVVHVFYEGEGYSGHEQTDAAVESYSVWSENLTQLGPVVPSDKFIFRVERRSPISGLRHNRQNYFASTKEYTLETLLTLQGKQGVGKDVRLPLVANEDGPEISEAYLVVQIRQLTAPFIAQRLQKEALAMTTLKPEEFLCSPVFAKLM